MKSFNSHKETVVAGFTLLRVHSCRDGEIETCEMLLPSDRDTVAYVKDLREQAKADQELFVSAIGCESESASQFSAPQRSVSMLVDESLTEIDGPSENSLTGDSSMLNGEISQTKEAASAKAAQTLRDSNVLSVLKAIDPDINIPELLDIQRKNSKKRLRFIIDLNLSLVHRFIGMPPLPGITKVGGGAFKSSENIELSCNKELGIWHESNDAVRTLLDFPMFAQSKPNMPYVVLWALRRVAPEVYKVLVGEEFGPAQEIVFSANRVLPVPISYEMTEPPFHFKYGLVFGQEYIHPTKLVNTFVTGATGVGKTFGTVKPLLLSFLDYKSMAGNLMSMLIIDPKSELFQVATFELEKSGQLHRLVRLGSGIQLSFFTDTCELGLEDRYRTLAGMVQIRSDGESAIWQEKGHRLNIDMAEVDLRFQLQTGYLLWGVVRSLIDGCDQTQRSQWENIHAIYKHALVSRVNLEWLACVSCILVELCPDLHGMKTVFTAYLNDAELMNQLFYRVSNAEEVCKRLSSVEVLNVFSTDLFARCDTGSTSIERLLDEGKVIVYQPSPYHSGDITGRLLKSRFFADVMTRRNMLQPVAYVADEFQRFISGDRDTGEQSFLDRCRSYRVNCVLATQSLASLQHALSQTGDRSASLAVEIIVANSPTKVVYRSMEPSTLQALKNWIPPAPAGRPHVVDIRPPSLLPVGSAYYLFNGDWGLYQYQKTDETVSEAAGSSITAQSSF